MSSTALVASENTSVRDSLLSRRSSNKSSGTTGRNSTLPHPGKRTTWWDLWFAFVSAAIGAGVVTLPSVFQTTGWGVALCLLGREQAGLFCGCVTVEVAPPPIQNPPLSHVPPLPRAQCPVTVSCRICAEVSCRMCGVSFHGYSLDRITGGGGVCGV